MTERPRLLCLHRASTGVPDSKGAGSEVMPASLGFQKTPMLNKKTAKGLGLPSDPPEGHMQLFPLWGCGCVT